MVPAFPRPSRRALLGGAAQAALLSAMPGAARAMPPPDGFPAKPEPFPLEAVRLSPSPYLDAVNANLGYLHRLEPDRLLHNFRTSAKLAPKAPAYGGWESETIAGHTLGHYLSACSLMFAQTGDAECKRRADYIVGELGECQRAQGDGYVAGFTRKRGGKIEDGKVIFAEIAKGDIRAQPFDLNGAWSPLYNLHKTLAGLLDANRYCGSAQALAVAAGLAGFLDGVFAGLGDDRVQKVLDCEHGGIAESLAELYARTHDARWIALARRLYHRKVLEPLTAQQDILDGLHSNTQIPKLIGLARISEVADVPDDATAARFFWGVTTSQHSYVIGGNGDREYFQAPNSTARYVTEQTCESCCSYNMLKLTRHIYRWYPDTAYFDYYERTHLNHILAQHDPSTGMFTYMMPLMAGAAREFSKPFDDFWCCVGTGMESHSKHGDSVYWRADDHLLVNLYIPSTLEWVERKARFRLDTRYPFSERIAFRVESVEGDAAFTIGLRIPAWCSEASVTVNGRGAAATRSRGYLLLRQTWSAGDEIVLTLPIALRTEPDTADRDLIALLHGPMVLAADLGPADRPYDAPAPALVTEKVLANIAPVAGQPAVYRSSGIGRPEDLTFVPFYRQYDRRTAPYVKTYTADEWRAARAARDAQAAQERELDARSVDIARLGDETDEKAHGLGASASYALVYRGRKGRDARSGGFFQFRMKTGPGPLVLRATYWGEERNRLFRILVAGQLVATQALDAQKPGGFVDIDYPLPAALTAGRKRVVVRFEPVGDHTAGPVFGCRLMPPMPPPPPPPK